MLVLRRKAGESIQIGPTITVTVQQVRARTVDLVVQAPDALDVCGSEMCVDGSARAESVIHIGDAVQVKVVQFKGTSVLLGVTAPRALKVLREELYCV